MTLKTYLTSRNTINAMLAIITFFLGLRILFRFVGANSGTPFVALVYNLSAALMAPFRGITSNLAFSTGTLDLVAVVSLVIYMLLGYLLISVFKSMVKPEQTVYKDRGPVVSHYHDIPVVRRRRRIF